MAEATSPAAARGLARRFVGEPETNGVIERLLRTLKEPIVHGRVCQTIEEVRDAVRAFVARYNAEWLVEKNGYRSPSDARTAWLDTNLRRTAYATPCPGSRVRYSVANTLTMDFLVREKVALTMSYTIMDTLPSPRDWRRTPAAEAIIVRAFRLAACGEEMRASAPPPPARPASRQASRRKRTRRPAPG